MAAILVLEDRQTTATVCSTIRCFNCRNRIGMADARVMASRVVACSRCASHRQIIRFRGIIIEIIGT